VKTTKAAADLRAKNHPKKAKTSTNSIGAKSTKHIKPINGASALVGGATWSLGLWASHLIYCRVVGISAASWLVFAWRLAHIPQ